MHTTEQQFISVFQTLLKELELLEKSSKKYYHQIRKAAFNPELAKALHHEQTGIDDHLRRLKLIAIELPKDVKKIEALKEIYSTKSYGRTKDNVRDLLMIAQAQQILQTKLADYKLLQRLANVLNLEHTPELLNQTIADNDATNTWLDKIAQRIISGETLIIELPQE